MQNVAVGVIILGGPFCRIEIEEHHKKGQTTPVVQWKRKEVSNQEREMMYKEASGILQK